MLQSFSMRSFVRTAYLVPSKRTICSSSISRNGQNTSSLEQSVGEEEGEGQDTQTMPAMTGKGDANRQAGGSLKEGGQSEEQGHIVHVYLLF